MVKYSWVAVSAWLFFAGILVADEKRDEQWKKVESALNEQGLPQTAIGHLDAIIESAKNDQAYDELILAIGRKILIEGQLEGGDASISIKKLRDQLDQFPAATQPILKAILADWYWGYYQQNRWRFMNRTQTAVPPGDDLTTWDLSRILAEVERLFTESLADRETLQATEVSRYDRLLQKGTMPDTYRPTLFDFLVHQSLSFYELAEQRIRPQGAFDLPASGPIFGTSADFLAWQLPESNGSPILQSLRLYQDLLRFHANDQDRTAFLAADLDRLSYGYRESYGEEKGARYQAALRRFADEHRGHELSSLAFARLAEFLQGENNLVEAHRVARQGAQLHPQSVGARNCQFILSQIELPSVAITAERVWNDPWPTIDVAYRNVTKVYFRIVPFDFVEGLRQGITAGEHIGEPMRRQVLSRPPVHAWSADLPATDDFQQRVESIDIPHNIPPGSYYLVASRDRSFREAESNSIYFCEVWVSKLAIVSRNQQGDGKIAGMVLDNQSGQPIQGAQVQFWRPVEMQRRSEYAPQETVTTDADGKYAFDGDENIPYLVVVTHGEHSLASTDAFWIRRLNWKARPFERTVFFTDRAIYRPGQTIQFKGICLAIDQDQDQYQAIPARAVTVALRDANGEDVEKLELKTNEFGSLSGSFVAPRGRVSGTMQLVVLSGPGGSGQVQVEEYKRPKFVVSVDAPKVAPRLDDTVTITGKALSYTAAPIGGAPVRYRIVREVRFPDWWFWRCWWWPHDSGRQEIAHGVTTTAVDGTFSIDFTAVPDRSVPKASEPTFRYAVHVDVVDGTGETRSAVGSIQVGYTALAAVLEVDDWQVPKSPVPLRISTRTLDGAPQAASGTVRVFTLKGPDHVHPPSLAGHPSPFLRHGPAPGETLKDAPPDWTDPRTWPNGAQQGEKEFTTDATGKVEVPWKLPTGAYRAVVETRDRFGTAVQSERVFLVVDPDQKKFTIPVADHLSAPTWAVQPGDEFTALWGTGYDRGQAYIEIEHRGKIVQAYWTPAESTQHIVRLPITEKLRGGFTVHVTHVQQNRAILHSRFVDVPWTNKQLTLRWERFVSKLQPAAKETWTAVITGPDAQGAIAEMVASLYDASLDSFVPHQWSEHFDIFRRDHTTLHLTFQNYARPMQVLVSGWLPNLAPVEITFRHFPGELLIAGGGYVGGMEMLGAPIQRQMRGAPAASVVLGDAVEASAERKGAPAEFAGRSTPADGVGDPNVEEILGEGGETGTDSRLDQVGVRTNLNETAFFFPKLMSDRSGTVRMEFTMPEALTEWRFLGFAHDRELRSGALTGTTVTAKDLMVQPNPPRFLREGDELEFTVKVTNQSPTSQKGSVRFSLADALSDESVDREFGNTHGDQSFEIAAGESQSFAWRISVPDGARMLVYRAVGASERLSDGEEGYLPVLSRRILVTEALSLPVRGKETRDFQFERLRDVADSDSLQHQGLTLQVTSNPAWYAVMALPYLMEYPHQCSEQVFNRLYANALARHIATSDPRIRRVFDQWRGTETLDSPLLKNEDLRSIMIEETPWLMDAKSESAARRNVGVLFDQNRMNDEQARALEQLKQMQFSDGTWPWFPGGAPNEFITLYIVTGFGRLRHLGARVEMGPALQALGELDHWITEIYDQIAQRGALDRNNLTATIALYLYGRSFFLADQPIAQSSRTAVDYFLEQSRQHWMRLDDRLPQGHLAIALRRFGDLETPKAIIRSLTERSRSDDEMGMFWREGEASWWWYRAPIETQALMIEVYDEVAADRHAVEELKIWLLKQKQTQNWKTTKATADAVYALLLRGTEMLSANELVQVTLGDVAVSPESAEAGTGYYSRHFPPSEITVDMADVHVINPNPGIAWGSLHWQYLEDISKITPHEGTPLTVTKSLFVKQNTERGPTLVPVTESVAVGDELVTRIELRVDRPMEFVHLRDQRGSGTEPVDVLSQYRFQDGLSYYQSTRDTATHFFIDNLPRGTYVFEYSVRVQHRGSYQAGIANVECMYAPEFNGHSASLPLVVK